MAWTFFVFLFQYALEEVVEGLRFFFTIGQQSQKINKQMRMFVGLLRWDFCGCTGIGARAGAAPVRPVGFCCFADLPLPLFKGGISRLILRQQHLLPSMVSA
jgi:hypothetical protein